MPKLPYTTHTDPPLTLEWRVDEGMQRVVFFSDETKAQPKVLFEGRSADEAQEVFDYTVDHYEQRKALAGVLCDLPGCEQRGRHSAEAHVSYLRRRKRGE